MEKRGDSGHIAPPHGPPGDENGGAHESGSSKEKSQLPPESNGFR